MSEDLVLPSDMPQADAPDDSASLVLPSDLAEQQTRAAAPSVAADVATGAATGLAKGSASLLGLPGDVQHMSNSLWDRAGLAVAHKAFDWTGYGPQAGTPDRDEFDKGWSALNDVGEAFSGPQSLPTSAGIISAGEKAAGHALPEAQTTTGKYAETIGEFVPATIGGPESLAKKMVYGAVVPGVTSEAAGQLTQGTSFEPAARLTGAFAGVGLGIAAQEAAKLGRKAASKIGDTFQPMTTAGQDAMAGQRIYGAALDPDAVRASLETPTADLVPGSKPTTFQMTGDMGLGSAEKTAETKDPVPFQQRRADQNQARIDAMTGIQPGGAPEDLAAGLRTHLANLDDIESGNVDAATRNAQDAATGIGGQQSPDFYGRQIQSAAQPQIDTARAGLSNALNRIGGTGAPEEYGAQLRSSAQDAKEAARQQRVALYRAIDPDGTMNIMGMTARQGAEEVAGSLSPIAAAPSGEEAAILGQMRTLPDVMPFRDLQALDSRITAARTAEYRAAGESPSYARLGQLKRHVLDAISGAVENEAAYQQQAMKAGELLPADTMEARIHQWGQSLLNDRFGFYSNREAGLRAVGGAGGDAGGRSAPIPRVSRAEGEGPDGSRNSAGDQGLQEPLRPNFDQAAADRLNVAKQTHAQYVQTFKDGPVGNMLKTNGFAGQYRMVDSGVPNQVFQPGPKGGDTLRAYMRAVGDNPQASGAVRNYAAMSLRRAAERPDGTIDLGRYGNWVDKHWDALRAMPNNGMREFSSIRPAQEALQRFHPFTEATAPSAIPEMFFHSGPAGGDGVANLRSLVGDHVATTALTDYAASKLRATALKSDGTLDPRKVEQFARSHGPALDALPGLADRFSNAARATETINTAAAARKAALDSYQRDTVGKIIGSTEPSDITRMVGDVFSKGTSVAQMRDLATKARQAGPDAIQGLRKAVADNLASRFMTNSEAATSGTNKISADAFQTFVKKNSAALGQVFKPEEVQSLQAIASDITRANRSRDAINIPGQSPTAQLQHRVAPAGQEHDSWLEAMFKGSFAAREIGEMLGSVPVLGHALEHLAPPLAMGTAVVKHIVGGMQAAGLKRVDQLYRDALLNPDLAKELLAKVKPAAHRKAPEAGLMTQIMRLGPFYGAQTVPDAPQSSPARAAGGRVEPTEAQKEAGNYAKDHIRFAGMDISIENQKGAERSGTAKDGRRWSVKMPAAYGYIRGTTGADGDHVDCYVGPDESSPFAWVINQMELQPRKFDEHKVMLGFRTREQALKTYEAGFSDGKGKQRIGKVMCMPIEPFKKWVGSEAALKPARARGGSIFGGTTGAGPFGVPTHGQIFGQGMEPAKATFAAGGVVLKSDDERARVGAARFQEQLKALHGEMKRRDADAVLIGSPEALLPSVDGFVASHRR